MNNTASEEKTKYTRISLYILLGIGLGLWLYLSAGTLIIAVIFILMACYLYRTLSANERRFILYSFCIAFLLRIIFATIYYYYIIEAGRLPLFGYDGEQYSGRALYISLLLRGDDLNKFFNLKSYGVYIPFFIKSYGGGIPPITEYQIGPVTYAISLIYAFFGYTPLTVRFFNCLLGTLSGIITYYIARDLFGIRVSRIACILTLFLPSLFLHSITALKDPLINFLFLLLVFVYVRYFSVSFQTRFIPAIIICLLGQFILRRKTFEPILLCVLILTYILSLKSRKLRPLVFLITIILGSLLFFNFERVSNAVHVIEQTAIRSHIGYVNTPGKTYRLLPDKYYALNENTISIKGREFIKYISKGLFHSLLEPFPTRYPLSREATLIYSFQMLLWYFLVPFFILGLLVVIRRYFWSALPLLLFFFSTWLVLAMTVGNPGTVFRMRDMIAPLFLVISVVGSVALQKV